MARTISEVAGVFFNYKTLGPFLIGSVSLGVLSNAAFQVLTNIVGETTPVAVAIGISALIILLGAISFVGWLVGRLELAPPRAVGTTAPKKHRGLIFMVSKVEPAVKAIEYHAGVLEHCFLVCSDQSHRDAETVRDRFAGRGIHFAPFAVIKDINNPLEYMKRIDEIYDSLPKGIHERDVIADYLGMTSHASVGMVLACIPHGRHLQYTRPVFGDQNTVTGVMDPMEIVIDAGVLIGPKSETKSAGVAARIAPE